MDDKMRTLPSHVDGRTKIGPMHWKKFAFKFIPIIIFPVIWFFSNPSPGSFFMLIIIIVLAFGAFSEFVSKETGLDILKDIIKYKKRGTIIYERSTKNVDTKFSWNKISNNEKKASQRNV